MSYNLNVNDDFYDRNKQTNSRLNFAEMPSANSNFFDPTNNYYAPQPPQNQPQMNTNQTTFYSDWSQSQFYNPNQPADNYNDPFSAQNYNNMAGNGTGISPNDFENEPPLLEELGINFEHIYRKTVCVLNPFAKPHESIIHDEDLAGPLVFCIAYGFSLLLLGKIQFGYVYGITALGCLTMYSLLNLMSEKGVSAICIASTLGYCLLPMVILSFLCSFFTLTGYVGLIVSLLFILWCSISSSKLFVTALSMVNQQILILYPCFLLYGIFALLNIF